MRVFSFLPKELVLSVNGRWNNSTFILSSSRSQRPRETGRTIRGAGKNAERRPCYKPAGITVRRTGGRGNWRGSSSGCRPTRQVSLVCTWSKTNTIVVPTFATQASLRSCIGIFVSSGARLPCHYRKRITWYRSPKGDTASIHDRRREFNLVLAWLTVLRKRHDTTWQITDLVGSKTRNCPSI